MSVEAQIINVMVACGESISARNMEIQALRQKLAEVEQQATQAAELAESRRVHVVNLTDVRNKAEGARDQLESELKAALAMEAARTKLLEEAETERDTLRNAATAFERDRDYWKDRAIRAEKYTP